MPGPRSPKPSVASSPPDGIPPETVFFGRSEVMRAVRRTVERVAGMNIPVLVLGESGTGKEVLARLVHQLSPWNVGPFVKVSCPAIPATLLESELFGYERGSFTGAYASKPGWVELAEGGTLFLDEIAELEIAVQAKLLHLLQDGAYFRIGGQEAKQVDLRVVCATNRVLEHEIEIGAFRRDLFYRISVFSVRLPPLRERRDDIPQIVEYLLGVYSQKYERQVRPLSRRILSLLMKHDWPGNIRELENLIRSYVVMNSEEAISDGLLSQDGSRARPAVASDGSRCLKELTQEAVQALERDVILSVLKSNNWNRKRAARALNISYRALFYKMKTSGIPAKRAMREFAAAVDPAQAKGRP